MLGCLCYGGGDWLMLYGDTARDGTLYWLTHGVARIPAWRNTLAMALAFLGIIYTVSRFCAGRFHPDRKETKGIPHIDRVRTNPMDCAALVLYYDIIRIFMDEYGQLCGGGAASWRSSVCPFFMGSACQ